MLPSVTLSAGILALLALSSCAAAQSVARGPPPDASDEDAAAVLAKRLQNPIASLITVPLQNQFDRK